MNDNDGSVEVLVDDAGGSLGSRRPVAPVIALAVAIVLAALFVVLLNADADGGPSGDRSRLLGQPAPESIGTLADGRPFDLSRRKGSWVMLNFFQSDCRPCIIEHPALVEFVDQQEALGSDGVEFYSIVVSDTREDVEAFFEERGGDWPVVMEHERIDVGFGVAQFPETWIIDPNGIVRAQFPGAVTTERLNVTMQTLREQSR